MNIFNENANEAHVVMFMIILYVSCLQKCVLHVYF